MSGVGRIRTTGHHPHGRWVVRQLPQEFRRQQYSKSLIGSWSENVSAVDACLLDFCSASRHIHMQVETGTYRSRYCSAQRGKYPQ